MSKKLAAAIVTLAGLAFTVASHASSYSNQYVFGDSLSDNGNLAELASISGIYPPGGFPNPPSYSNGFSNGPLATQILANSLGLTSNPSLWVTGFQDPANLFGGASFVPGTNYAVAGATAQSMAAGGSPVINLPQQIAAFSAYNSGVADPAALYVLFIGGNDVADAVASGAGASAINSAVQTELGSVQTLANEGARNFLVVNVPNVGSTPEFAANQAAAAVATSLSELYDSDLSTGLGALTLPTSDQLTQFDLYSYDANLLANASALGITDINDPCYTDAPYSAATTPACGPGAENISSLAYWNAFHPTAVIQNQWALGFEAALPNTAPTPEPSTLTLLGSGIACMAGLASRRRRAAK